jgi:hypothetical protein
MGWLGAIIGGAVGFLVGGPAGAAIGFGLGMTKVGEKIINKVMDFVLKPFLGDFGMPQDGASAAREEGILITKRGGGSEQIPIIYGFRQVGGIITFATTGSDRNRYLWVAYVLSEGPVEGIHSISIDDNDITATDLIGALNRGEQFDVNTGKYANRVKMQFWYGKNFGTAASSSPVGANAFMSEAPGWRTTDAYNGLATLFVRYEWRQVTTQEESDNNPFSGSIPSIKVNLLGRRILPIDATASTTTYINDINAGRERYSTNPAEIILDYLRNPWYGKGLSNSEIDWNSFQTARNKYNTDVTYVSGVRGPILTTNVVLDSGQTLMSNIKTLLQGCRSYLPYVQGKYKLKVEDAGNDNDITSGSATVVKTFTSDNIVGDISYGGVPRDSVFSEYEITYVDPTNKWATNTVVYPTTEAERLAYQTIDGGRVNKGSTTFPTLTNYAMAYDMARLLFNKSRQQETLSVKVTSEAFDLEPGDNIQVQGNTLSFTVGETATPWRIISIKANDDYTFDLGCVKNPDSIYPHTRAGERDIIIPPYIPRYESIDYPTTDVDLSLYPPSYAYTGGQAIVSPLDPPGATDPTGPTGGGNGDADGEQNTNPITVPPSPAPPVQQVFNHAIDITNVVYTVTGNVASATLTFAQPDSPSFAGVDFWISSVGGRSPNYTLPASTQIPGVGRPITYIVNNLVHSQSYNFYARVKYSNGNSSIVAVRIVLNSTGILNSGNVEETPLNAGPGWQPEGGVSTYVNSRNTTFAALSAVASLDGSSNRKLALTLRQDISVQAGGVNPEVGGVNIYYKLSANTYWKKLVYRFDGAYQFGNNYTFTPTLDLGVNNPSPDDPTDNFDFVFRFTYNDATESTVQWRLMNIDIQPNWNPSGIDPIGENTTAATAPIIITEDQAPPGSVADTRNMTVGLTQVAYIRAGTGNSLRFTINTPDVSNRVSWRGVDIKYRIIPTGATTSPAFETLPVLGLSGNTATFNLPIPREGEYYQIAVTPLVVYSGSRTEAYSSWYGEGRVSTVYDNSGPNDTLGATYFTRMNFRPIQTSQIAGSPIPPPPTANPVVTVRSFARKTGAINATVQPTNTPNSRYFELIYNTDHIVGLTGVRIYRRSNVLVSTGFTLHYGLGRWESIDVVVGTNAQALGSDVIVNLRCPVSYFEFRPRFGLTGSTDPLLSATAPALNPWGSKVQLTEQRMDIIIVATTSSGTSTDCAYLITDEFDGNGNYRTGLLTDIRPLTQFNGYTSSPTNYLRNISSSVSNRTTNLVSSNLTSAVWVAPTPTRGGAVL